MSLRKSWVRLSCQATLQPYEHRRDQGVICGGLPVPQPKHESLGMARTAPGPNTDTTQSKGLPAGQTSSQQTPCRSPQPLSTPTALNPTDNDPTSRLREQAGQETKGLAAKLHPKSPRVPPEVILLEQGALPAPMHIASRLRSPRALTPYCHIPAPCELPAYNQDGRRGEDLPCTHSCKASLC